MRDVEGWGYPRWRFRQDHPAGVLVKTAEEDEALGTGWVHAPAALAVATPEPPEPEPVEDPDADADGEATPDAEQPAPRRSHHKKKQ